MYTDSNWEQCQYIVEEMQKYYNGAVVKCNHCGETFELDDEHPVCPNCHGDDLEQQSLYDFLDDVFDIEYRSGADGELRSVKLMIACGGPNIYIDTGVAKVQLYWGADYADAWIPEKICEDINTIFEEIWLACR